MTPMDSQNFESFVPVYDVVPEKWEDARPFLVEQLKTLANAVNIREIGWWLDQEVLSGKALFPGVNIEGNFTPPQNRQILRQVYDFGTLPNNSTKSIAHNIVVDANFSLITLYAGSFNGVNAIPIPYSSTISGNNVEIFMDTTNIYIRTASNYSSYTNTKITAEYCQEG